MREQPGEFLERPFFHALGEELLRFEHERVFVDRRVVDAVEAAFAGHFPSLHPVAHVSAALHTKLHISGQNSPDEVLRSRQFEVSAFGLEREGVDAAVGTTAAEVHQKEMALELIGQSGPRKKGHAGRTGGDIGNWRNDVGRLAVKMRIPKFLRVERSPRVGTLHELIADAPAAVAAFHDVNPARLIAAVGVVVAGEKISVLIENQVLRIAQAESEHFEVGAVRIATEDATGVGFAHTAAISELHV